MIPKITPFLWFDTNAEEAANLYVSLFPNSKILNIVRTPKGGAGPEGSVLVVAFELDGMKFSAMNGGPMFKFNESISMVIHCKDQDEVDHYWNGLIADGGQQSDCGWLKDKFGLSWQVTPDILVTYLGDQNREKAASVMAAMMTMQKIDIAKLQEAYDAK
jgi:predicted 3-demethylubiquinone-9 3-methyltransferase (glyoxalase superfamily)